MQFSAFFLFSLMTHCIVLCEHKPNKKQKSKYGLVLLGDVHGYETNQYTNLKFPAFLISPVVIMPITNSKGNVDSKMSNNESSENDIEINFRQALGRGSASVKELKEITNETRERINDTVNNNNTTTDQTESTTIESTTLEQNLIEENTTEKFTSTENPGIYPNVYNNEAINSLTVTIREPDDILYPPLTDEQWKKFTVSTNNSILKENTTKPSASDSINFTGYPSVNDTDSLIKGVYPASLYNNAEIDQLSITTNSYTNESPLPPPLDDRWRSFSSLGEMLPKSNEFRPLAGLYYDGFLHRPILKAPGFVPYNEYDFIKSL